MKARSATSCLLAAWAAAPALGLAGAGPLQEPVVQGTTVVVETYGDARNVRLLADLLADPDPLVREQALRGLGETHNPDAMPHIRRAMKDPDPSVRCAVVAAAAELGSPQAGEVVAAGLADADHTVALTAAREARAMKLTSAASQVQALLAREDRHVRAVALHALTVLGRAAPAEALEALLKSPSPLVRLRAAENAALPGGAGRLRDELLRLARDDGPAVRGAALAALGRHDFEAAGPLLTEAGRSPHALVRRGAVLACTHAARGERIRAFLDDPSPLVRLAASRSAGELKRADCVGRLLELMLSAPDAQAHLQARDSLRRIGTPAVAKGAAAALKDVRPKLLRGREAYQASLSARAEQSGQQLQGVRLLERNVGACCWLLGQLRSKEAYDLVGELAGSEKTDSQLLGEAAAALGRIGDRRAAGPLAARLGDCRKLAPTYLQQQLAVNPVYVPFNEEITGQIVLALAELGGGGAVDEMLSLALTTVQGLRLTWSAACVARVLPALAPSADRAKVERALVTMLTADGYSLIVRFESAKAAGKLKLKAAVPALEKVLNEDRPCRPVMRAAAWALQEITGRTPDVPAPKVKQGRWIIRTLKK